MLVNRQLYEECEIDDQCNGTSGKVVCREIQGRKLCLCKDGFIEDNTALKCLQGNILEVRSISNLLNCFETVFMNLYVFCEQANKPSFEVDFLRVTVKYIYTNHSQNHLIL